MTSIRSSAARCLGKLLSIRDTPESMARGLAVGFFFGISFLLGLQTVLAVVVSYLIRGNKLVAATLTAVSNPITSLPLYGMCYWVGQLVLGRKAELPNLDSVRSVDAFLALGPSFFLAMFIGTTLVGLIGSVALYLSANRIFATLGRWHARHAAARSAARPTGPGGAQPEDSAV